MSKHGPTPAADDGRIIESYEHAQRAAVLEIADQGLLSLASLVDTGAIDVSPNFQRRDRWNPEKQSRLIESFFSNIPVPPVYLAEDTARLGSYAVIDGKQRLTAISVFFSDRLVLEGLTRFKILNGRSYSQLPAGMRTSLGMKNLRVTTLLRQSSEDLKHEVFLRLNTGGEVLNHQEIRNVAYRGPLNDLIYRLGESSYLRDQLKVKPPHSPGYKQMVDAEFVLRFFALSSRWREFRGSIRDELDSFMIENRFADDIQLQRLNDLFESCTSTVQGIWGDSAFKRPGRDQALAGLFDAQMIAAKELTNEKRQKAVSQKTRIRREFSKLFKNREFDEAIRQATNTPSRLRYRVEQSLEVLARVVG